MELQSVGHSKAMLEKELQEVIALTSQELEEQREKVLELQDEVGEPCCPGSPGLEHGPGAQRGPRPRVCARRAAPGSLTTRCWAPCTQSSTSTLARTGTPR